MFSAFANSFKIPELRQRILFTLAVLVFVRLGAAIPVPGINSAVLGEYFSSIANQQQGSVIALFNIFSGGALQNCAIFSLTIMPYISASIIMQLAQGVVPSLARLAREDGGRQKIIQYTRIGTLLLCLVQGYIFASAFENPTDNLLHGISDVIAKMGPLVPEKGLAFRVLTVLTLTAGTMLLMWMGEQITERGIGNGVSLIIAIGILARLPSALVSGWSVIMPPEGSDQAPLSPVIVVLLVGFLFGVIAATIMITQAMRKVPVSYAKQVRGNRMYQGQTSFLPLKVNYAGVMPIIFASAILLFPSTIVSFAFKDSAAAQRFAQALNPGGSLYYFLYGGMIFFFSYFWVAMVFNPTQIADDMKRNGGFIPGVRPGEPTAKFLDFSMTRLTFAGGIFLVFLAILPQFLNRVMGVPMVTSQFFGGTGLLIIVGVMLDTMRHTETYLLQRHYDGFLKKGRLRGRSAFDRYTTGDTLSSDRLIWLLVVVGIIVIGGIVAISIK